MRKLVVKFLSLQCTIVKGSLMGVIFTVFGLPLFLILTFADWIERASPKRLKEWLAAPFPMPGIMKEAGEQCDMNVKRLERVVFGPDEPTGR
jgi:hypothetical protein